MKKILKKIIYRGCLKDLYYLILGIFIFIILPILGEFLVEFIFYKLGV